MISSLDDQAAPGQDLARDALDAAAGRLQGGEKGYLHLRLGADQLDLADVLRRLDHAVERHVHQLSHIRSRRSGADAEEAAIGEGPVERIDGIGEAAGLAHLMPEARGQPAAENMGEEVRARK